MTRHRIIYVFCPAQIRTGGPEALHQLGRALIDLGHDARMVYISGDSTPQMRGTAQDFPEIADPVDAAYRHYQVPFSWRIEDDEAHGLVVPEMWPAMVRHFQFLTPYLWWLSIDKGLAAVSAFGGWKAIAGSRYCHLAQSHYAQSYLAERGLVALPLFDYTTPELMAFAESVDLTAPRRNRILTPARGRWFTNWLRRWAPDLDWQEISGFTAEEVRELFRTSKLYADFGTHPGKDRMPREAALLGCCVITGRIGSAGNPFDIPIPAGYKLDARRYKFPVILRKIRAVLAEYDRRQADFDLYRQVIRGERAEFLAQTARCFGGAIIAAPETAPREYV